MIKISWDTLNFTKIKCKYLINFTQKLYNSKFLVLLSSELTKEQFLYKNFLVIK